MSSIVNFGEHYRVKVGQGDEGKRGEAYGVELAFEQRMGVCPCCATIGAWTPNYQVRLNAEQAELFIFAMQVAAMKVKP